MSWACSLSVNLPFLSPCFCPSNHLYLYLFGGLCVCCLSTCVRECSSVCLSTEILVCLIESENLSANNLNPFRWSLENEKSAAPLRLAITRVSSFQSQRETHTRETMMAKVARREECIRNSINARLLLYYTYSERDESLDLVADSEVVPVP